MIEKKNKMSNEDLMALKNAIGGFLLEYRDINDSPTKLEKFPLVDKIIINYQAQLKLIDVILGDGKSLMADDLILEAKETYGIDLK